MEPTAALGKVDEQAPQPTHALKRAPAPEAASTLVVVVSSPVYWALWWFVFLVHVTIVAFALLLALVHLTLSLPAVHLNTVGLAVSMQAKCVTGVVYALTAVLHAHAVARILRVSIHRGGVHLRLTTEDSVLETNTSSLEENGHARSITRRVYWRLGRAWMNLYGPAGMLSVGSALFPVLLVVREAIEVFLQSYQTWTMSYSVTSVRINSFAVGVVALNCWSLVVVDALAKHESQRRLLHLAADLSLDFACSVAVPVSIVLRYVVAFDWTTGRFPLELIRNDVWFANAISEGKQVLVTTPVDFVSSLLPLYSTFRHLQTLSKLVRRPHSSLSTATIVPVAPATPSLECTPSSAYGLAPSKRQHRFIHIVSVLIGVWGVVLLSVHVHANGFARRRENPGCKLYSRTWLATNATCSVQHVNCYRLGIAGHAHEVASVFNGLERSVLTKLVFLHCPALAMPPQFTQFRELNRLEVVNTTLVRWSTDAAIREMTHPVLTSITFRLVNVSELPEALAHGDLPHRLMYLGFFNCSLASLPNNIGELWAPSGLKQLLFDANRLRALPASLRYEWLWASSNEIQELPDSLFDQATPSSLRLSRNPLVRLPSSMDTSRLEDLLLDHTNVSSVPPWAMAWLEANPTAIALGRASLRGSPVCAMNLPQAIAAACARDGLTPHGPLPLEVYQELYPV